MAIVNAQSKENEEITLLTLRFFVNNSLGCGWLNFVWTSFFVHQFASTFQQLSNNGNDEKSTNDGCKTPKKYAIFIANYLFPASFQISEMQQEQVGLKGLKVEAEKQARRKIYHKN